MIRPGIILIGAGGHAHACIEVIEGHEQFQVAGLVGTGEEVGAEHLGYPVIASDAELPRLAKEYQYALVTVGQIASPDTRIRLYQRALDAGFTLPQVIASTAHVSRHASVEEGTVVMHGAIVNAGARIGRNCIINTRALVEHDAVVENHCHISTGVILNGSARIGEGSFVGSGSVVRDRITVGKNCVIGMGLCVRHSQSGSTKWVGDDKS